MSSGRCTHCGAPIDAARVAEREKRGSFREWFVEFPNPNGPRFVPLSSVVKVQGNVKEGDRVSGAYVERWDDVIYSADPNGPGKVVEPCD